MDPPGGGWWNVSRRAHKTHEPNKEHRFSKASIGQPISISNPSEIQAHSPENAHCPTMTMKCIILQKNDKGFGLTVSGDNPVYVEAVKEDGAAHKAGVQEGDRIIKVNGTNVTEYGHIQVVKLIKADSYVALTLLGVPVGSSPGSETAQQLAASDHNKNMSNKTNNPFHDQKLETIKRMLEQAAAGYERIKDEYAKKPSDHLLKDLQTAQNVKQDLNKKLWRAKSVATTPPPPPPAAAQPNIFSSSSLFGASMTKRISKFTTDIDESLGLEDKGDLRSKRGISSSAVDLRSPTVDSDNNTSSSSSYQHRSSNNDIILNNGVSSGSAGGGSNRSSNRSSSDNVTIHFDSSSVMPSSLPNYQMEGSRQQNSSSSITSATPSNMPVQNTNIMNFEDDDMVEDCDADHGPFNDLEKLRQRPAHFAVFLNYVIQQHEPPSLLFLIAVDSYKQISGSKDLHKQADVIYKHFLHANAPFKVKVDEAMSSSIYSKTHTSKHPSEDTCRMLFDPAVQNCTKEIREQLAQYRKKREQGLGNMFGDEKLPQQGSDAIGFDPAYEQKLVDDLIGTQIDDLIHSTGIDTGSSGNYTPEQTAIIQEVLNGFINQHGSKRSQGKLDRVFSIIGHKKSELRPRKNISTSTETINEDPAKLDKKRRFFRRDNDMSMSGSVGSATTTGAGGSITSSGSSSNVRGSSSSNDIESLTVDAAKKPSRSGSFRGRRQNEKRHANTSKSHSDPDKDKVELAVSQHSITVDNIDNNSGGGDSVKGGFKQPLQLPSLDDPELEVKAVEHWSTSVPKEVRKKMTKSDINRQEVINELLYTEQHHIRDLLILQKLFYESLKTSSLLESEELNTIFANLQTILTMHRELNLALQKVKEADGHVVKEIGDVILARFDGEPGEEFKRECAKFCGNQSKSLSFMKKRSGRDQKFNEYLAELQRHPKCRKLHLKDFIPMEFQRLTKYPLLLESINKHTKNKNTIEFKKIETGSERARGILAFVNSEVKCSEDTQQLREIQQNLERHPLNKCNDEFKDFDLLGHPCIHQGSLQFNQGIMEKKKVQSMHIIVYEHVVLLLDRSNDKYVLKSYGNAPKAAQSISPFISMKNLIVRSVATDKFAFFIISQQQGLYMFIASSNKQKQSWMNVLEDAALKYNKKHVHSVMTNPKSKEANDTTSDHSQQADVLDGQDEAPQLTEVDFPLPDTNAISLEDLTAQATPVLQGDASATSTDDDNIACCSSPVETVDITPVLPTSSCLNTRQVQAKQKLCANQEEVSNLLKDSTNQLAEIANVHPAHNLEPILEMTIADNSADPKALLLHSVFCVNKLLEMCNKSMSPENTYVIRKQTQNHNTSPSTAVAEPTSSEMNQDEVSDATTTTGYPNSEQNSATSSDHNGAAIYERWATPVEHDYENRHQDTVTPSGSALVSTPDEVSELQTHLSNDNVLVTTSGISADDTVDVDNTLYERLTTPGVSSPAATNGGGGELMVGTALMPLSELRELVVSLQVQLDRMLKLQENSAEATATADTSVQGDNYQQTLDDDNQPPPTYEELEGL